MLQIMSDIVTDYFDLSVNRQSGVHLKSTNERFLIV